MILLLSAREYKVSEKYVRLHSVIYSTSKSDVFWFYKCSRLFWVHAVHFAWGFMLAKHDASVSMMLLSVVGWNVCNRVYCIHVPGHDPLIISFRSFSFFDWVRVLWPQLSKVLKLVRWAGSIPFSPVSLQRQVVCLLLWPVFVCSSRGRAYTVSWLVGVQIKVML